MFLRALELRNIAQACQEAGISPQRYQYWWRRFRDSGFRREGLEERSRRPNKSPRRLAPQVERWILAYRNKFGHSGEKIRMLLERDRGVKVSLPTVYRVLSRRGGKRRRAAKAKREKVTIIPSRTALALPATPESKLPKKLGGHYRVLRFLGSGGGGAVYLVEDERTGERRALKWIEAQGGNDSGLDACIENEFAALAALSHQNLARVFDLGMTDRGLFFTSEYIPGRDFLTATHGADLNTVFQLIVQILAALDYLHRRGILHLDLKPNNILVSDPDASGELRVQLIDFGAAEWRKRGQGEAGETMGTPPYVAPELLMERPPGPAADLYGLGMILHQVFFGKFPFRAADPVLMMQEQVYEEPLRLAGLPPALPEGFTDLLQRMVARDPERRFGSAAEVLAAFNHCLGENYSLRPMPIPAAILNESEHLFRRALFEDLLTAFQERQAQVVVLSGPEGSGKSYLARRLKEALQLNRVFPRPCDTPGSVAAALREGATDPRTPLWIDWRADAEPEDFAATLEALDGAQVSALVTTRREFSSEWLATRWEALPPLRPTEVLTFFQAEVADFPPLEAEAPWLRLGAGSPRQLETLLAALWEAGAIRWGERGWQWVSEAIVDFDGLLSSHDELWRERRCRTLEILALAPRGMTVELLATVLGISTVALAGPLRAWVEQGYLRARGEKRVLYFTEAEPRTLSAAKAGGGDWEKIGRELAGLYAAGEFEAGARWADELFAAPEGERPPASVALLCARHYAAAGEGVRALETLPDSTVLPAESGLVNEVRARGQLQTGDLAAADRDLGEAEEAYLRQGDGAGRSRVANLRGSLAKKRGDFALARESFREAIARAQAAGDDYLAGLAEMNLALLHQEQGEFREAHAGYAAAQASAERAGHPALHARLLHNRLNLAFNMGRSQEAEQLCRALFRIAWRHQYFDLQAAALNFSALLAAQQGHQERREDYLNQSLRLWEGRAPSPAYLQSLLNRAFFFWEQGRYTPAELDASHALGLAKRLQQVLFTAWSQLLLGRILRDRPKPDLEAAERYLHRAHQGIHRARNRQLLWEVEADRGFLALRRGQKAAAKGFFLSARDHLRELLKEVPEIVQKSYLRDRKLEKLEEQLQKLESR